METFFCTMCARDLASMGVSAVEVARPQSGEANGSVQAKGSSGMPPPPRNHTEVVRLLQRVNNLEQSISELRTIVQGTQDDVRKEIQWLRDNAIPVFFHRSVEFGEPYGIKLD